MLGTASGEASPIWTSPVRSLMKFILLLGLTRSRCAAKVNESPKEELTEQMKPRWASQKTTRQKNDGPRWLPMGLTSNPSDCCLLTWRWPFFFSNRVRTHTDELEVAHATAKLERGARTRRAQRARPNNSGEDWGMRTCARHTTVKCPPRRTTSETELILGTGTRDTRN
jgi:hypothetical protein